MDRVQRISRTKFQAILRPFPGGSAGQSNGNGGRRERSRDIILLMS
jgi:hypothetical protein